MSQQIHLAILRSKKYEKLLLHILIKGIYGWVDNVELKIMDSPHKNCLESDLCRILKLVTTVAVSE
jgi:hypothetical protein